MTTTALAFIDTETTGLDPDRNPIWEVAVIVDGIEHVWQVAHHQDLPIVAERGRPPVLGQWVSQWVIDNTGYGTRYNATTALEPWSPSIGSPNSSTADTWSGWSHRSTKNGCAACTPPSTEIRGR